MNVAILNLKDIIKKTVKLLITLISFIVFFSVINNKIYISNNSFEISLKKCLKQELAGGLVSLKVSDIKLEDKKIISLSSKLLVKNEKTAEEIKTLNKEEIIKENNELPTIPKEALTVEVSEKNIEQSFTNIYGSVRIKNQSKYQLTEEMITPNFKIANKEKILIFHTHTSESYTPCEKYPYTMTGNYRTTDSNYNMIRIGNELTNYLTLKGFNVIHDTTIHDYPSYSGSYNRSLNTVQNLLYNNNDCQLVIDLHRDAIGNGDTYGPTVSINGQSVAQLMFVIGTDGGGLEHPNWINNLKTAVLIQEKANELYPGLFRPIILRNSRYNQHLANGACIIEVGATANTLEEAMLSMQCLANILEEL